MNIVNSIQNCPNRSILRNIKNLSVYLLFIISCATTPAEPISYVKQPSTGGEVAVAKTLENMLTAYNEQDFDKYLSFFAPDARIDSIIAGRMVSKVEYQKHLKKRSKFTILQLKNTIIKKISPIKYQVDAILSGRNFLNISYELVPLKGRWVILEQHYQ